MLLLIVSLCYQSAIDRWNTLFEGYAKNAWSEGLYNLTNNVVPLSIHHGMRFGVL